MKTARLTLVLPLLFLFRFATAQYDTLHYMYSFASVGAGYDINIHPYANSINSYGRPFWANGGPTINVSGLIAFKQSYFGIPVMLGYSQAAFNVHDYASFQADTNPSPYKTYGSGNAGNYNIYYLLTGINLKIPAHTTRYTIELRALIGPVIATLPNIEFSYINPLSAAIVAPAITTQITSKTIIALGFCPGISAGYKLTQHFALMGNIDLIYAQLNFNPTATTIGNGKETTRKIFMESDISYLKISAGVAYTFGRMTPNIEY
ncbi:MAG TPA: hypothetical protein VK806_06490 [Bacteroidia bacterium]|jgi:hypothetical protein|nr:hypothetical protein [Bacteroidia bacterium]